MEKEYYAFKNKFGYNILSLVIDRDAKKATVYKGCVAPIAKYKKRSKKSITEMFGDVPSDWDKEVL